MKVLKYTDKFLLLITTVLFIFGLVMIFSASNVAAFMRYETSPYRFLIKQSFFLLTGLFIFLFILNRKTTVYSVLSWPLMFSFIGLLIGVLIFGKVVGNARSWIDIGPISLQPSEFIKIITIIWLASWFEIRRKALNTKLTIIIPIITCAIVIALILKQPDMGTAALYAFIVFFTCLMTRIDWRLKLKTIMFFVVAGLIVVLGMQAAGKNLFSETQLKKIDFRYPCSEEKFYGSGNQVCNSYIALHNGGLTGKGLGNSTQKYLYLPEAHTDFIFAIIVEELGLIGGAIVILLLFLVIVDIIIIGRCSISSRGSIICYGIAGYIFIHCIVNLLGIMGAMPITGIPLPFLSYGGSFTWCLMASLAIVQRVAVETKMAKLGILEKAPSRVEKKMMEGFEKAQQNVKKSTQGVRKPVRKK